MRGHRELYQRVRDETLGGLGRVIGAEGLTDAAEKVVAAAGAA